MTVMTLNNQKRYWLALFIASTLCLYADNLCLTDNGKTEYRIVNCGDSPIDDFAAKELAKFLKKSTAADFAISTEEGEKNIFLGKHRLPGNPRDTFSISFQNNDIYLDGSGKYGCLNAAYEFLEAIGIRFFTPYNEMLIPEKNTLSIPTTPITGEYSFRVRSSQTFFHRNNKENAALYHYRNRQNMLLAEFPGIENIEFEYKPSTHTLSYYIHPGVEFEGDMERQGRFARQLSWIEEKNYFKVHPEWFPMNEKGERYTHGQLCFSNHELRQELTKNAMEQLKREMERTGRDDGVFSMTMNDIVYAEFCCCPKCRELGKKYNQKGAGAFYEYLVEFCNEMKQRYPNVTVTSFAYLSSLAAPEGLALPDNLVVIFAPIYSNYISPLEEEKDQNTLKIVDGWKKLIKRIWYWYYPLPYKEGGKYLFMPPISNIRRICMDMAKIHELGLEGTYVEHDSGSNDLTGFFELQSYLLLRLYRNVGDNVEKIIEEFTDFYYGKAASLFRTYLSEVEKGCQEAGNTKMRAVYNTLEYPFLNERNLRKWQDMFDEMAKLTADDAQALYHVKLSRLAVDATLITILAQTQDAKLTNDAIEKFEGQIKELKEKYNYPFDMTRIAKWKQALLNTEK